MTEVTYRTAPTPDLGAAGLAQLLDLFAAAWPDGDFSPDDAAHALGGTHWLAEADGRIVGHAAVVERALDADGRRLRAGYVEAVATLPAWRGRGVASRLMEAAADHVRAMFEIGVLSTGIAGFYERLGWVAWLGPTVVRVPGGPDLVARAGEEGIMVLVTPSTPALTLRETLGCEERPGDAW